MSETVHYKGYLKEVPIVRESLELTLGKIIVDNGYKYPETYYGGVVEYFEDNFYVDYYINHKTGRVFEIVISSNDLQDEDIFKVHPSSKLRFDYEFELKYHNGGCSETEALDNAFRVFRGE